MPFWTRLTRSPAACGAAALLLAAAVAWLDFAIKSEISFAIAYLIPVGFAAWYAGRRAGLGIALLCALVWLADETVLEPHRFIQPAAPYVNAALRLAAFALIAYLLSTIRRMLEREQALNQFKNDMLSLVTHEFNNALAVMSLGLMVLKEGEPSPEGRRAEIYGTLERQTKSLKQSVTNFLGYARTENGRMALLMKETPPDRLLEETLSMLAPLAEQKSLRIEREVSRAPQVRADPEALTIVLTNLLGNAVKFTPNGGLVGVKLMPTPGGEGVRFVVEDTGIGMTDDQLRRFASELPQAEPLKRPGSGFGVGLRLSREILRGHGAELRVVSHPGLGTRFTFELPVWK